MTMASLLLPSSLRLLARPSSCITNNKRSSLSRLRFTTTARLSQTAVRAFSSFRGGGPPPPPRFSSSSTNNNPPPNRLRRPAKFDSSRGGRRGGGGGHFQDSSAEKQQSLSRPHTISFFPGDFQDDDDDVANPFDDDDEDDEDLYGAMDTAQAAEYAAMVEELRRREQEIADKKARWIANSAKPVRHSVIDKYGRSYGRGGRKTAQARVWITAGLGEIVINRKPLVEYFDRLSTRELVLAPLVATETVGDFDVTVAVQGGGLVGQAGAVRHGLARALVNYNPDAYRAPLRVLGFLTRDARKVERKKIGRKKARKSPQWVRR